MLKKTLATFFFAIPYKLLVEQTLPGQLMMKKMIKTSQDK